MSILYRDIDNNLNKILSKLNHNNKYSTSKLLLRKTSEKWTMLYSMLYVIRLWLNLKFPNITYVQYS